MDHAPLYRNASLSRAQSEAIRLARVVCILSMVTVHFWPGAGRILTGAGPAAAHPFYLLLVDYLGRSSVPLLSVISGALFILSARGFDGPWQILPKKLRSLIVPMILWSAALLLLYLLHASATGDRSRLPQDLPGWINALFALTAPPANLPLAFLRDTFVCGLILATTLSLALTLRWPVLALLLPVLAALLQHQTGLPLVLRPQIALFFALGAALALSGGLRLSPPWILVLALLVLDIGLRNALGGELPVWARELLNRIAMSLLVWKLCETLVRHAPTLAQRLRRIEPYTFTLFCSHMLAVTLVAGVTGALDYSETRDSYLLVFLLQYPLALALAVALVETRRRLRNRRAPALNQP